MKKPEPNHSPTFCVMPWTNLATETNGKCKICCVAMSNKYIQNNQGVDFQIQNDSIDQIWNSNDLKSIRKKMLNGERVPECSYCYSQEDAGAQSPRQSYNKTWLDSSAKQLVIDSKINDGIVQKPPVSLEPRPGTLCNLKCNMCWSMSSSKIYAERKAAIEGSIKNIPEFLRNFWVYELEVADKSDFTWSENPTYIANLEKCIPTLKRLYFTGGEPTLIQSNFDFVKKLLEAGKTDTLISFTTNLQQFDQKWTDLLSHFSRVEITGSLDGLDHRNEYIRYPSQWDKVKASIDLHYKKYHQTALSLMITVQAMNVLSLADIMEWIIDNYPGRQIQLITTLLQDPHYLSIHILPDHLKNKAYQRIEKLIQTRSLTEDNLRHFTNVLEYLKTSSPDTEELRDQFRQYVHYLDQQRGTDFRQTFPELSELLLTESKPHHHQA